MRAAAMKRCLLLFLAACAPTAPSPGIDTALEGLALTSVDPGTLVPGSTIVVTGRSFVDEDWGESTLVITGSGTELRLPARHVSGSELRVAWKGGEAPVGELLGLAHVEVVSAVDGLTYRSQVVDVDMDVKDELWPTLGEVATGVIFVNDAIVVDGSDFLLGEGEGDTFVRLSGCYAVEGGACEPIESLELPASPDSRFDRTRLTFPFAPAVAGIRPGRFEGTLELLNRHAGGAVRESASQAVDFDVVPPRIFRIVPGAASLGQYVDIEGGGFVGGPGMGDLVTTVELEGRFTPAGGAPVDIVLTLVPEFASGRRVRYVLNEEDELGQRVDLRRVTGSFAGRARPIVQAGAVTVVGDDADVSLALAPVKQVVHVDFQPSYVESLRHFGLRAVDSAIRRRVLAVAARDYAGIHVEFRVDAPEDFAYYAEVDISGPDPNGLGLLGYDNSPGKDIGNARLYDRIGGVNAQTQADGFPGFGGVFVESFFGFSLHPGGFAVTLDRGAEPLFDEIFDPFRPDRGGRPASAADFAELESLADGASCPARDRRGQVACAVFVLGNMIGTTMTHEVGHSLGLANPTEEAAFHNVGDQPDRLMDAGGARTFRERAELGEGPARFCDGDFEYLREILPGASADPVARPGCY
jgi:hypothetical protein